MKEYSKKTDQLRKRIMIRNAIALLVIAIVIYILIQSKMTYFEGERVRNPDAYLMTFDYMNMKDSNTMHLEIGDRLHVEYEIKKGKVDVTIGMQGDDLIYRGNDIETGTFDLPIEKAGDYIVSVHGKKAQGSMNFTVAQK